MVNELSILEYWQTQQYRRSRMIPFDYFINTYNTSRDIEICQNCNAISITNIGDDTVIVGGMVLFPGTLNTSLGDSRTIGGNENEIFSKKRITIAFAGAGANPNVEIIQKFYT